MAGPVSELGEFTIGLEEMLIRAAFGHRPEPAVDLYGCARELGVADVRVADRVDGFTDFTSRWPIIYVASATNPARVRFTLAHELAHVIVRNPDALAVGGERLANALARDEERLADRIAATLLLPSAWVHALATVGVDWPNLHHVSMRARVSHSMLVTRLSSEGFNTGLLRWRRGKGDWVVIGRPGVPRFLNGRVEAPPEGQAALSVAPQGVSVLTMPIIVRGHTMSLPGSLRRDHDSASLLFRGNDLRRATQSPS